MTIDVSNFIHGKMRRCLLLDDGTVNYYLHPNDSTLKEDGTPAVLDGSDGQVMVEIPKFWYNKVVDGDDIHFIISDKPREDLVVHPAFYRDRNGDGVAEEVDFRYMSAFMGYVMNGKLCSLPYKIPTESKSITIFRSEAQSRGVGWGIVDYNLIYAIQILYITEYGHPDSQTQIGRGYVDNNSSSVQTGNTLQYGNNTFGETTGKKQISYRGIEDLWGNASYWLDGLNTDNYDILIGNVNFNNNGTGYKRISNANKVNINGNIRDIHDDEDAGFLIKSAGGAYTADGLYDNGQFNSSHLPVFGGSRSYGSNSGIFSIRLTHTYGGVSSARLSY